MKDNPLLTACLFFLLGIWAARLTHIPLVLVASSLVLFLIIALVSLKNNLLFSLSLALAIFCAGFLHLKGAQNYSANHILNFVSDTPQEVYLRGRVVSAPESSQTFYGSQKSVFTLRAADLKTGQGWQAAQGLVKVTLYGGRKPAYGDEVLLQGLLSRPPGLRNPGGFDYRAYLANHKIFGLLQVKQNHALKIISRRQSLLRGIFSFKQRLHEIIFRYLQPPQANLLAAILLGERAGLSEELKDSFIQSGTIHILAISGLHVGLIALILIILFRFLRLSRNQGFILTIIFLIAYVFLSGGRASVVRAALMATVVLIGLLINREAKIYNSLGLAALLILIFNPHYLFDAGFGLSFLSVISIVYFAPRIENLFILRNRAPAYLVKAFSVSFSAWIGIAPLVAYHFSIVTPVAILANIIMVPLLFLVVSAGVCFLSFAFIWAPLGAIFAQTSWLTLLGLTRSAALLAAIPPGFFHTPSPGIFYIFGYYAFLLLVFNYKRLKLSPAKVAITLLLAGNILIYEPLLQGPDGKLRVTFLDVGLGDAAFIEFPYGGTMLIDGGPSGEFDAGRMIVLPFLWNKAINQIDAVMLTHPDNDHLGGLVSILKNVTVGYVFDNGDSKKSADYYEYKTQVVKRVPHYRLLKRGVKICGFPGVELFVLYPAKPFLTATGADTNNNSLVLKLVYKDTSFIFCADVQARAMEQLLVYSPMLKSTVIKVPHHGSKEGEVEEDLFKAISAQVAVISVDKNNRFGLPAPEVTGPLEKMGVKVYKTSEHGAVTISTDGRQIWVETMIGAEAGI